MFMSKNWKELLCRCETCVEFYTHSGISFLIDGEDSIVEYEKIATQKRQEKLQQQEGAELDFLNKLSHVAKIEILSGINDMKIELQSFMESADSSKTITSTSADVRQVFENLAKKRQCLLSFITSQSLLESNWTREGPDCFAPTWVAFRVGTFLSSLSD
ncbi:hypothetical protein IFM89_025206 [Coptis chinensis]|uniref:Uncharacterized protein n=1 Tax=Coptis chinensis TaxID=261450 RepID=A0A835IZU7_9MAGN|nr:hypothetical protein IFM89_025206 [Coptis chinensis]